MKTSKNLSTQSLSGFLIGIILTAAVFRFSATAPGIQASQIQEWIAFENTPIHPLSVTDKRYLESKGEITKCIDPHWLPLEGSVGGQHVGVISELLNSVEKVLGSPIRLVETKDWAESIDYLRQGKCDIVTPDVETGTSDYLKTIPFISLHHAYIVRSSEPMEVDFSNIKHKTIGIPKGYPTKDLLVERYGEVNFVEVATVDEGVELVSRGELFAFADILPVISYSISQQGLTNVKVGGHLDLDLPTVMAVNPDQPQLVDILNKLFLLADRNISSQILSKWVKVKYEVNVDWFKWLKVFLFFGAVLLLFIIWNRKLALMNSQLDTTNSELKRLTEQDSLTGLNNRYYLRELLLPQLYSESTCSIALADIDHFKCINDTHGHATGDRCLQQFSKLVKQVFCEADDHCIRYGGEEFLIISTLNDANAFAVRLERLRIACEQLEMEDTKGNRVKMTASFGSVSDVQVGSATDLEIALGRADEYLYEAKKGGRNQIRH